MKGVSTCPARLLPPPRLGPRAGVCARPAWRVCGSLGGSFCPLGGRLAAAASYFAANSALVLLLLLLRRAEAACRDGGEGAGVRGWVCCDGVLSVVGGGWRVRELWRRGGGGCLQAQFSLDMRRREAKKGKAPSQKEALNDAEKDDLSPEEAWTTYGVNVSPSKTTKTRFVMAYRSRLRPARQQKQTDRGPANHVQVRDPGTKSRRADAAATAYAFTGPDTDSTDGVCARNHPLFYFVVHNCN